MKDYEIINLGANENDENNNRAINFFCPDGICGDIICPDAICADTNCGSCSGPDIQCAPNYGMCGTRSRIE